MCDWYTTFAPVSPAMSQCCVPASQFIPIITLVCQPLWGAYADKAGKHRFVLNLSLVCGTLLRCCMGFAAYALPHTATVTPLHSASASPQYFWSIAALLVATEAVSCAFLPLVDASAMALLGDSRRSQYGKLRLWGAVGWGLCAPLVGYWMRHNGTFALFGVHALGMCAVGVILRQLPTPLKTPASSAVASASPSHGGGAPGSVLSGVGAVLRAPGVLPFLATVATVVSVCSGRFMACLSHICRLLLPADDVVLQGWLAGIISAYLFVYLASLGGSVVLMGVSLTVTCIAEVPVFFYSGRLVEVLGELGVFTLTFACFTLRMLAYSLLTSAEWVLPVEVLHGITFGAGVCVRVSCDALSRVCDAAAVVCERDEAAWAAATMYSRRVAPVGLEATMQSVLAASQSGLGFGGGGFIGGLIYQRYGAVVLFRVAACVAGTACCVLCAWTLRTRASRKTAHTDGKRGSVSVEMASQDSGTPAPSRDDSASNSEDEEGQGLLAVDA